MHSVCKISCASRYQQMVPDPGGSPAGGFDFVSCVQESSATPLLDVQSIKHHGKNSPATYFPGLQQVVIRDYMNADRLKPHFGAGTDHGAAVVAINCSLTFSSTTCGFAK